MNWDLILKIAIYGILPVVWWVVKKILTHDSDIMEHKYKLQNMAEINAIKQKDFDELKADMKEVKTQTIQQTVLLEQIKATINAPKNNS